MLLVEAPNTRRGITYDRRGFYTLRAPRGAVSLVTPPLRDSWGVDGGSGSTPNQRGATNLPGLLGEGPIPECAGWGEMCSHTFQGGGQGTPTNGPVWALRSF